MHWTRNTRRKCWNYVEENLKCIMGSLQQSMAEIMSRALCVWWFLISFSCQSQSERYLKQSHVLLCGVEVWFAKVSALEVLRAQNHPNVWNPDLQKEEEDVWKQTNRDDEDRMAGVRWVRGEWMGAFCTQHSYLLWVYHLWGNMNANRLKKSVSLQTETGEQQDFWRKVLKHFCFIQVFLSAHFQKQKFDTMREDSTQCYNLFMFA